MNQKALKGKNPQGLNPIGILSKSFESKEASKCSRKILASYCL
jgi:hypothetical protein